MKCKFFIVNQFGEIIPCAFHSLESAMSCCDWGETVFLTGSLEELEEVISGIFEGYKEETPYY